MPQVTVPPVSENSLQNLLSVHLSACSYALAHYSMGITECKTSRLAPKATGTQGLCISFSAQGQGSGYESGVSGRL